MQTKYKLEENFKNGFIKFKNYVCIYDFYGRGLILKIVCMLSNLQNIKYSK